MPFQAPHLILTEFTEVLPYTSNNLGRSIDIRPIHDRQDQGTRVRDRFNVAIENAGFEDSEFIYVTFQSAYGFFLDLEKLDKRNFRLSSIRKIEITDDMEQLQWYYEATICLNRNAVAEFLNKVDQYLTLNRNSGNPYHRSLMANIEDIKAATIESFWQEPEIPLPTRDQTVWWEVWLSRFPEDNENDFVNELTQEMGEQEIQIASRYLSFPENWVFLMKATIAQLGTALLYSNRLCELRKPKETADFFTYLDIQEQAGWIEDLSGRVRHVVESPISICLLDTGVNIANPLLTNLIPARNLDAVEPAWTKADNHIHGHGTPMAGLVLYGDLTEPLAGNFPIEITHHVESIKLIDRNHPHDPEMYGAVTQEAIYRGEVLFPDNKRVVCMAVTSDALIHEGRPSSWSAAIDQFIFGSTDEPNDKTIVLISAGNLSLEDRLSYPLRNDECSIEDPAQSFNALTVGAYTLKDQLDLGDFPNSELLAERGAMSPCNTTSVGWDNEWCRKPDIVMEGGNNGIMDGNLVEADSMQLLTTSKGGIGRSWLYAFADTSAATALAAKLTAELYFAYPSLWPETIRGLVVHSADWTPVMLTNKHIAQLSENEKKTLIAKVGYGVPNLEKARHSANNSLSLIAERSIYPFKLEGSTVKTDEFHLFDLPWPVEALEDLFDTEVELKITLSYFIEPNPGSKRYELAASYRSHGLRFRIIDSNETVDAFKARVSKAMRDETYVPEGGEHWILGNKVRDKGSIHKDIWQGTAADLSTRNKIAIFPVGGWWKTRKTQERYGFAIRYSLIVSIETALQDVDFYTPVNNLINLDLEL